MNRRILARLRRWFWPATPRSVGAMPAGARAKTLLPEGLRIYAIGDVHGEALLLDDLAGRIEADLRRDPPGTALAVFVGDYIDRGPETRAVIARLAAGDFPVPFETLRGNHEDLMLQALGAPEAMPPWLHTGAIATLESYGLDVSKASSAKALGRLREGLLDALPPAHKAFFEATKLSLSVGGYFFVHAGARPGVALDAQDPQDLMWIREECYGSDYDFGKVLVHGHTPHKRPENLARRINVDTGAFKWGVLTAAVLEGDQRRFLSTRD